MKAEYINPFLSATKNVLETMCQTAVTAQKPYLKENTCSFGDVSGIVGMASDTVTGCMVLSFTESCILQIVAKMLYEDPKSTIDEDIIDAVGELTNMICGGARAQLAKLNSQFDLATPTMIKGKGVEISYFSEAPTIVIPFSTDDGGFVVEANLAQKKS